LRTNDFPPFPEPWGELAHLLRETHERLEEAGAAGVDRAELAALSRAARHALKVAADDPGEAVERVGLVVLDARELAGRAG
jgi:hypothetical protein